ncbi:homoserine O-acetyltransferase [Xylona heveae TC161]|uniref:Homoserine O-acetyltransferase n=1 Tax=Xylona heveae (strain CBS 132557 / TC161) TaxID=1328760 RepID=A0A165H526_XYLHT|nr:homoserine O-acetyltransferase [Xylona heveae TC161]KZF22993.1 homoserine O-acetyltransferase [Xylona heveae TC161]
MNVVKVTLRSADLSGPACHKSIGAKAIIYNPFYDFTPYPSLTVQKIGDIEGNEGDKVTPRPRLLAVVNFGALRWIEIEEQGKEEGHAKEMIHVQCLKFELVISMISRRAQIKRPFAIMKGIKSVIFAARRASQAPLAQQRKPVTSRILPQSMRNGRYSTSLNPATTRSISTGRPRKAQEATAERESSNPALAFPCLDALESRSASLRSRPSEQGPEPSYTSGDHLRFHSEKPILLDWGGLLPEFDVAYETWGELNSDRSNAILLHTGLSASSHAKSSDLNPKPGWWEKFIGPGLAVDTNKYFVICTNVIGSCYGSTGPSSIDPANGQRYGTRFPILTMEDMVRAQFRLLDGLGIKKLYASVGSSMGGMQSLAAAVLFPDRVGKVVSISGCARSHPYSVAMRHTQRQVLMMDPNWNRGFYYDGIPPHAGMKLAREIATVTYRSGPEWEQRFGRRRADPSKPPALCPDFLIETYLDHAGEKFCLQYDPNSLLYVSKAMDLFDLGVDNQNRMRALRHQNKSKLAAGEGPGPEGQSCNLTLPESPYEEQPSETTSRSLNDAVDAPAGGPPADLVAGLGPMQHHPTLVMGVASDILFPAWQQREIAETLKAAGNRQVTHVELGEDKSLFGHDTFLLDLEHIGGNLKRFLN